MNDSREAEQISGQAKSNNQASLSDETAASAVSGGESLSKHTPAPWRVSDASGWENARLEVLTTIDSRHIVIADCGREGNSIAQVNAHLIAAAPELFNTLRSVEPLLVKLGIALDNLKDQSPRPAETHDLVNVALAFSSEARAVIAKAEGRTPAK